MLLSVTLENCLSFDNPVTISFEKQVRNSTHNPKHHMFEDKKTDVKVVRCAAFYGINASGKSNIIKAVYFFKRIIIENKLNEIPTISFFYNDKPVKISIECFTNQKIFSYDLVFSNKEIISETLSYKNKMNADFKIIYDTNNNSFKKDDNLINGHTETLQAVARGSNTQSALYALYHNKGFSDDIKKSDFIKYIKSFFDYIDKNIDIITPDKTYNDISYMLAKGEDSYKEWLVHFLKRFDTEISDICFEEVSDGYVIKNIFLNDKSNFDDFLSHIQNEYQNADLQIIQGTLKTKDSLIFTKYDGQKHQFEAMKTKHHTINGEKKLTFKDSSTGTKRLFELASVFCPRIKHRPQVLLIDELEKNLHPDIVKDLIESFLKKDNFEEKSQLILATHAECLWDNDVLRNDSFYIVQKYTDCHSDIQRLPDIAPKLRFDTVRKNAYHLGLFGGKPHISS